MLFHNKYRTESARLTGWDYSAPGYYFLTVCTHDRSNLFGEIINDKMARNNFGQIVYEEWGKSFEIRRELVRDEFVVMPNHFHGIVRLIDIGDQIVVATVPVLAPPIFPVETSGRTSLQRTLQRDQRDKNRERRPDQPEQRTDKQIRPKSISSFMAGVKSVITKRINETRNTPSAPVLQPRFHDHIVRNEQELFRIRQYIKDNPANWAKDKFKNGFENTVREDVVEYEKEKWMI